MSLLTDAQAAAIYDRLHIIWHMLLFLASTYCTQVNPQKYGWLGPVLQAYGQISPVPQLSGGSK